MDIKESYSMGKKLKKVEKNSQRNFIKQGGGGGSKAVYKLYKKKQEKWSGLASLNGKRDIGDREDWDGDDADRDDGDGGV